MTLASISPELRGEGLAREPFQARGLDGQECLPPVRQDAPVLVWVRCRARGPDGQECLPPVRPDAPVLAWVRCRARGLDGRECLPPVRPDALGDS